MMLEASWSGRLVGHSPDRPLLYPYCYRERRGSYLTSLAPLDEVFSAPPVPLVTRVTVEFIGSGLALFLPPIKVFDHQACTHQGDSRQDRMQRCRGIETGLRDMALVIPPFL